MRLRPKALICREEGSHRKVKFHQTYPTKFGGAGHTFTRTSPCRSTGFGISPMTMFSMGPLPSLTITARIVDIVEEVLSLFVGRG